MPYFFLKSSCTSIVLLLLTLFFTETHPGKIVDSNRCSTAPLEHNFGIARINSNDNNRMDNLIKKFSYLDVRRIDKFNFTKKVLRHRVTNYGTEINTSYININFEKIENKAKILISKFYNDFKKKILQKIFQNYLIFN